MENNSTKHIDSLLNKDRLPFSKSKEEAWKAVAARTSKEVKVISIKSALLPNLLKVAAVVTLLFLGGGVSLYFGGSQTIMNNADTPLVYELPDGSTIYLNSDAELSYNKYFYKLRRNTALHGEAFFKVEKGSPFAVRTQHGLVRVLGTSFNVLSTGDTFQVQCKTGKVAVDFPSSPSLELSPGHAVRLQESEVNRSSVNPDYIGMWFNTRYEFDDVAVSEVLLKVAADKGYEIRWNSDFALRYTGQFSQQESLENTLDIICKPLNLTYDIDYSSKAITIHKQ